MEKFEVIASNYMVGVTQAFLSSAFIPLTPTGLLQMQLILHYDETYREVKYGSLGLEDIDNKMLMGINVTPIISLLYTPVLIRYSMGFFNGLLL